MYTRVLALVCLYCVSMYVEVIGISTCCFYTKSLTCRRNCQRLVADRKYRFGHAYVSRRLSDIVKTCTRSESLLWNCLIESKLWRDFREEALSRRSKHGYCCREAKHLSCEIKCLTSKNMLQANNDYCNVMREPQLVQCLKRIDVSKKCCKNRNSDCQGICEKYFRSSVSVAIFIHKNTLEKACGKDSKTYKCAIVNTNIKAVVRDHLACCSQKTEYACEQRCREVFNNSGDYNEMFQALEAQCGVFDISTSIYKCLLETSETSNKDRKGKNNPDKIQRTVIENKVQPTSFKQQCCHRAKSIKCMKWCLGTLPRPNLMALWDTMYLTCIQSPAEAELSTCMSDLMEPCNFGGNQNLEFCTNFNGRPLGLFRRFDHVGDSAAQKLHKFWSDGIVPVLQYKLIFKDIKTCQPDKFKALACLIAVKPCEHHIVQRQVCRKDCVDLLTSCLDHSLTKISVSIEEVCAVILPKENQTECISVSAFIERPKHVQINNEVTFPCSGNPCQHGKVCQINHECIKASVRNCQPYTCVTGCALSSKNGLVIPYGQLAKLKVTEGRIQCFQICECKSTWQSYEKQPLYNFGLCKNFGCYKHLNCTKNGKIYRDGEMFHHQCNTCICSDGNVVCTEKDCYNVLTNDSKQPQHRHSLTISDNEDSCKCDNIYNPLCGKNGMTFANSCHAKCCYMDDHTLGIGDCQKVEPCKPNPCPGRLKCVPSKRVCLSPWTACSQYTCQNEDNKSNSSCGPWSKMAKQELCGYDGVTYKNSCMLEQSGTGIDYKGPCLPVKYQNIADSVQRCSKIKCEPIKLKHCNHIRIPGACCPVCGSTLRVIYSQKDLLRYYNFISSDHFTVTDIVKHLRQLLHVAECSLYAHILVPGELAIVIIVNSKTPTHSQFIACRSEAKRFHKYINHKSPIINTNYYLSVLKASRLKINQWNASSAVIIHDKHYANVLLLISFVCIYIVFSR